MKKHPEPPALTAALITPRGEGGISIIALSGRGALQTARRHVMSRKGNPRRLRVGRLSYGFFCGRAGEPLDEVIAACRDEEYVEINCHGGLQPAAKVLAMLQSEGVALAEADCRTVALPGMGLIEKEALECLECARTDLAARVLAAQAGGLLRAALEDIAGKIEHGAAAGDLCLLLRALRSTATTGLALSAPRTIAVAGPPNAGKSSIVNALVGYSRNIVTDVPGTTRDAVRIQVSLHGIPAVLIDTAGLPGGVEGVAGEAAKRARSALEKADAVLLVIDASAPLPSRYAPPPENARMLVAANKCDLRGNADTAAVISDWGLIVVPVAAVTGQGVPLLVSALIGLLGVPQPAADIAGKPVVFTARQLRLIDDAVSALDAGKPANARESLVRCMYGG